MFKIYHQCPTTKTKSNALAITIVVSFKNFLKEFASDLDFRLIFREVQVYKIC